MIVGIKGLLTGERGAKSEAIVEARLLLAGYNVLVPRGNHLRYDCVIEDVDGKFWRVQVKTARLAYEGTVLIFAVASSDNHTTAKRGWRSYQGQVDYFGVYSPDLDKCFLVSAHLVGTNNCTLRLVPTKNNQMKGVLWALDYAL
jgi:hypothetical protein